MIHRKAPVWPVCAVAIGLSIAATAQAAEYRTDHAVVLYEGISERYAEAIAQTVETARQTCVDTFGFDMPDLITVRVTARAGQNVRLFNDGADTFSLSLRSEQDLRQPAASGTFHLYGLCHEVAHLAMYRPIQDRGWLTTAGAEGWAHYLGSHLVDAVYKQAGEDLWPDRYDYRQDGSPRLTRQMASEQPSDVVRGAMLWRQFAVLVGRDNVARAFAAWGRAQIDPANPAATVGQATAELATDEAMLQSWLAEADVLLFQKRPQSEFPLRQLATSDVTGEPLELAHDDGKSAGRKSVAGGGHAVRFEVPDSSWHVTSVSLFGSRYGPPRPPMEQFSVWLCDDQMRAITEFKLPYARFERGDAKWVKLPVKPTAVPQKFIVVFGFNPSAQKGVYVSHDAQTTGQSLSGLPGRPPREFSAGDWLIRLEVDQAKTADALGQD